MLFAPRTPAKGRNAGRAARRASHYHISRSGPGIFPADATWKGLSGSSQPAESDRVALTHAHRARRTALDGTPQRDRAVHARPDGTPRAGGARGAVDPLRGPRPGAGPGRRGGTLLAVAPTAALDP